MTRNHYLLFFRLIPIHLSSSVVDTYSSNLFLYCLSDGIKTSHLWTKRLRDCGIPVHVQVAHAGTALHHRKAIERYVTSMFGKSSTVDLVPATTGNFALHQDSVMSQQRQLQRHYTY